MGRRGVTLLAKKSSARPKPGTHVLQQVDYRKAAFAAGGLILIPTFGPGAATL